MRKKLTIEYIRSEFEKEGYTLLSEEYVNNSEKLNYRCDKVHEHSIRWNDWLKGQRCSYCHGNNRATIEYIKESFKKESYLLLSKEYVSTKTKLDYICSNSHTHSIRWDAWKRGQRCPICACNVKLDISYIKKSFEDSNYILLSNEYINAHTKLDYRCSNGHEHSIKWNDWCGGHKCPTCAGVIKLTIEHIKKDFEQKDCILLSNSYINSKTKLDYICSNGHNHSIIWSSWQRGHRCQTCADINLSIKFSGSGHPNWQGGISYEPYCPIWKDKEYKKDIRLRDGNKCLNPYCYSNKPDKLTIHHIDYNKKNCSPSNLITVCRSCNGMANKDRDWHTTWYQAIIKNRYGGVKNAYINN